MTFDNYTIKHLDAWLAEQISGDTCRESIKAAMIEFASEDPEYWSSQGWWNLFDRAKCEDIRVRFN